MRRRVDTIALLLTCAGLATGAAAEELHFSLGGTTAWESDIRQGRGGDDVVWELRPQVRLQGEHQRFRYEVDYNLRAEFYRRLTELNDQGHNVRAFGTFQLSPTTTWSAENNLSLAPSVRRLNEVQVDASGEAIVDETGEQLVVEEFEDRDILTNRFSTTVTTRPWQRIEGVVTLEHFLRDFDGGRTGSLISQNIDSVTLTSTASYLFDENKRAGVGFRYRRRESTRAGPGGAGEELDLVSTFYDVFATWSQDLDPRTFVSFQVGPSLGSDDLEESAATFEVDAFPLSGEDPRRLLAQAGDGLLAPLGSGACPAVATDSGPAFVLTDDCPAVRFSLRPNAFPPPLFFQANTPELTDNQLEILSDLTRDVGFLPGEDDDDFGGSNVNIFASALLQRSWDHWQWVVRYNRSDSQTQSTGSQTVLDSVSTSLRWTPTPRWRGLLTFRFSRRTTDLERGTPVPVLGTPTAIPELGSFSTMGLQFNYFGAPIVGFANLESEQTFFVDLYSVQLRFQRDVTARAFVFAEAEWRRQDSGGDLVFTRTDDRYEFRVGFRYRFRPIRL